MFILADDLGFGDLGSKGHPYALTPNLDRLAREGTVVQQYYASSPVCSPSRAAFLTGRFPLELGLKTYLSATTSPTWGQVTALPRDCDNLARRLAEAGYTNANIGKWHLSWTSPLQYGFHLERGTGVFWQNNYTFNSDSARKMGVEALRFINHQANGPFYLQLWFTAVHTPVVARTADIARFAGLDVSAADFEGPMADYVASMVAELGQQEVNSRWQTYLAVVWTIDEVVGWILDELHALGLAERTIIVFASDNGPSDYRLNEAGNPGAGSTGCLRGRKGELYEGGIRSPTVFWAPGRVPAGRDLADTVMAAVDFPATMLGLAGVGVSVDSHQGVDFSDVLLGAPERERKPPLFWYREPLNLNSIMSFAVRRGEWKLLQNKAGDVSELYNLDLDPSETVNLAESDHHTVTYLSQLLEAWKSQCPAILGTQIVLNPEPVRVAANEAFELSVEAIGRYPIYYRWYRDGKMIDLSDPAFEVPRAGVLAVDPALASPGSLSGSYECRALGRNETVVSKPAVVTVMPEALPEEVRTLDPNYLSWMRNTRHSLSALGYLDDHDGDGIANLEEFFLRGDDDLNGDGLLDDGLAFDPNATGWTWKRPEFLRSLAGGWMALAPIGETTPRCRPLFSEDLQTWIVEEDLAVRVTGGSAPDERASIDGSQRWRPFVQVEIQVP